jgi:hypothetical protein
MVCHLIVYLNSWVPLDVGHARVYRTRAAVEQQSRGSNERSDQRWVIAHAEKQYNTASNKP